MSIRPTSAPDDAPADSIWSRGGGWVFAQFPLTALALLAARIGPTVPTVVLAPLRWVGLGLLALGGALMVAGVLRLGSNLTPFPKPLADARLVEIGAYGLARHPIYGGGVIAIFGWALLNGGWLGLLAAALLSVFFNAKANREEQWLRARYPAYAAYRQRVRKLIPFVY
jgi:protein-S-isoprenylcysteine O-methyltransferase Ste14